ncbi:MAG: TetR/AcrR family transcriptional regulator [Bacteroidales bacterium]
MGITERKIKEKLELKALILAAARKLFIEKGIEETSLRNIAEVIEYSPATIYLYFKDKDEILHELHSQGFQELGARMSVLQAVSDPLERLKALGRVYIDFAHQNTEMYDLMFIARAPMDYLEKKNDADWDEGKRAFGYLVQTVQDCLDSGLFKGHDADPLSFVIWSTVHGMVALEIRDRCKGISDEDPKVIFRSAFEAFIRMLDSL